MLRNLGSSLHLVTIFCVSEFQIPNFFKKNLIGGWINAELFSAKQQHEAVVGIRMFPPL